MPTGAADDRLWDGIRRRGAARFTADVIRRFRQADGTSHSRALAYQSMFVLLSGLIGFVGLASVLGLAGLRRIIQETVKAVSPGPAGHLLQQAARQGAGGGVTAMIVGLLAALAAGTLAMAQIERSTDRISGEPGDRTGGRRYALAFAIALSAGILLAIGGFVLVGGSAIATGAGWKGAGATVWSVLRWPIGIGVAGAGFYLLYRTAPQRTLTPRSVITAGAIVGLALWVIFTALLAVYYTFGGGSQTYGPLISIIALLVWSNLSALAVHLGYAAACELSRARPGMATPDTAGVVAIPDSDAVAGFHDAERMQHGTPLGGAPGSA